MLYVALGHDGPPQQYWTENLLTGAPLARCPIRELLLARDRDPELMGELERYTDTYYPAYRDGFLLVAGGVADQPARYLAVNRVIADLNVTADEKYLEISKEDAT